MTRRALRTLLAKKKGLLLDISFGGTPQARSISTQEIGHNPLVIPYPLPKNSVNTAVITHVLEYLPPMHWFAWWDELHRIMQPDGMVYISGPYGGDQSQGWLSDPTHQTRVIEQSFAWLDPRMPTWAEHAICGRELPRPWHPQSLKRVPGPNGTISYNVSLRAVKG